MAKEEQDNGLNFDLPKNRSSVIKVIGVGGGGSNAVNHMKQTGIKGVDFVVCNTDAQALEHSAVENRIQLGATLTEGLGAGANPEVGRDAATESLDEIREILSHNTRMVFITAGMGGGTGTGAAPVIARLAKEMNILTVGIVTKPFRFEGKIRAKQAQEGIDRLREHVDSLVVINNDKLREVYGNLSFRSGFAKADEVLGTAAKGIAEVITYHFTTNIDLRDVRTVLENSGTAIMGSSQSNGENRAKEAVESALDSPLLNDNHIHGAKNVLLLIVSGSGDQEITMDEMSYINEHIQDEAGGNANVILGIGIDEDLDDTISVTVIATGFPSNQSDILSGRSTPKIVHPLDEDQPIEQDVFERPFEKNEAPKAPENKAEKTQPDLFSEINPEPEVVHELNDEADENNFEIIDEDTTVVVAEEENDEDYSTPNNPVEEEISPSFDANNSADEDDLIAETESEHTVVGEIALEDEDFTPSAKGENATKDEHDATEDEMTFELDEIDGDGIELTIENEESSETIEASEKNENEADYDPFDFKIDDVMEAPQKEKLEITKDETPAPKNIDSPIDETKKEGGVVRHTLEDLRALEDRLQIKKPSENSETPAAKADAEKQEVAQDDLLDIKTKSTEEQNADASTNNEEDEDLINQPIGAASRKKILERRNRLQQYAYSFKTHKSNILSKEPAYKRQGFDLGADKYSSQENASQMSISGDGNETEIKTNNSFLHDNVD